MYNVHLPFTEISFRMSISNQRVQVEISSTTEENSTPLKKNIYIWYIIHRSVHIWHVLEHCVGFLWANTRTRMHIIHLVTVTRFHGLIYIQHFALAIENQCLNVKSFLMYQPWKKRSSLMYQPYFDSTNIFWNP